MLVTAELRRGGVTLGAADVLKDSGHVYSISAEQREILGGELAVIAGPHPAYSDTPVFTVELLSLPARTAAWDPKLPYAPDAGDVTSYVTVYIDKLCPE